MLRGVGGSDPCNQSEFRVISSTQTIYVAFVENNGIAGSKSASIVRVRPPGIWMAHCGLQRDVNGIPTGADAAFNDRIFYLSEREYREVAPWISGLDDDGRKSRRLDRFVESQSHVTRPAPNSGSLFAVMVTVTPLCKVTIPRTVRTAV